MSKDRKEIKKILKYIFAVLAYRYIFEYTTGKLMHCSIRKVLVLVFCFSCKAICAQQKDSPKTDSAVSILAEVIVTASRVKESLLHSPVSIQKAGDQYFAASAAPSFFDALEHLQGVQMITPSMGFRVLNARGFANTTNVRFAQLVDGMDVQSPHIGGPMQTPSDPVTWMWIMWKSCQA